ncbi:MAG TPA: SpoIIE family protein phosphatase [Ignavibacteriaceae bacterium]|nr:SpoIIE family protein phosphatase [Ignavibacteriaceae bacterium]
MPDNDSLKTKRNLTALVEFSRIINSSLDLNFILNNVLLTCLGKFLATKGLIALKFDDKLLLKSSKGLTEQNISKFPELQAGEDFSLNDNFKNYLQDVNLKAVEKINSSNDCLGIVCLGEKLNKQDYTKDDLDFLKTILNISASAIQNSLIVEELKFVNRELDSRIQRLSSLFELSKEFGLFSESTKVTRLLVFSLIGQFLVQKYALLRFEGNDIEVIEPKFPVDELLRNIRQIDYFQIETSLNSNQVALLYPALFKMGVEVIVPMQIQGKTKGLIILGKRFNNLEYKDSDIEFIFSVGSLAIISMENRRLFIEALEKQKLEEELDLARDIQRNLLPQKIPYYKNFEISAINLSSKQVGGDYYDVIRLDENNCCIAIADVSGKGVPASLLMANIQAFLQVICKQNVPLDEATGLINDLISQNTSDGRFITFFWGIFNDIKKEVKYVNAGHNPPLLIRDGKITKLSTGGIILGVMKTFIPYKSETVQLKSDDVLILFTDGISEAMNKNGEEFSDEALEKLALSLSGKPAEEILQEIKNEVQHFAEGAPQSDDITLVVIKVK